MDIETQNFIEDTGKQFLKNRLDDIEIDWKQAALRFGEELATSGPDGYYLFTPQQWLDHALEQWKALTAGITQLKPFHDEKKAESFTSSNWKSIESAPEDGTPILGYSTMGRIYIIKFDGRWHNMPECDFTHWMPLPNTDSIAGK